jgi:hypothetical protein
MPVLRHPVNAIGWTTSHLHLAQSVVDDRRSSGKIAMITIQYPRHVLSWMTDDRRAPGNIETIVAKNQGMQGTRSNFREGSRNYRQPCGHGGC